MTAPVAPTTTTVALDAISLWLPAPDAAALAQALAAVAGTSDPIWGDIVADGGPGRACRIPLSTGWVEVVESGGSYVAHPEILSIGTTDPGAAVGRLLAAGIDVPPPISGDSRVWGNLFIGGVRVLVVDAG